MTILYPKAFHEAEPKAFDGQFHWEYIDDKLRRIRNIHSADIDDAVEINGNFLHIETSDNAEKFLAESNGQNRRTAAYLRTGLVAQLDIVGKIIPVQWRWRGRGWCDPWQFSADGRAEIAARVERWAHWADSLSRSQRELLALQSAWEEASQQARRDFIDRLSDFDLSAALGPLANTELGRAAIEQIRCQQFREV